MNNITNYRELRLAVATLAKLGYLITVDRNGTPRLRHLDGRFAGVQ